METIKQNALLVKEELRVKKWKGINVLQEVNSNLNIFFTEKKELKRSTPNLRFYLSRRITAGVMI